MSKEEILFIRNMLLDRRSSVLERVRKISAAWLEMEDRAIEIQEEAQKASISRSNETLDQNSKREIEQIDIALFKISLGDYGICESCGDDIAPKRLQVLPWARLCVECARDFEKQKKTLPRETETVVSGKVPDEFTGMAGEKIVGLIYDRFNADERIDTDDLAVSFRRGVVYLDGAVATEAEHELIVRVLTESMGFSAVVDRIGVGEVQPDNDELQVGSSENAGGDSHFFSDRDLSSEQSFEAQGSASDGIYS